METWIDLILQWDEELFLFLNGLHHPMLDTLMLWVTNKYFWIPLYIFILFLIYRQYKWPGRYVVLTIVLVVIGSDQVTSSFMKPFFERLRPCYDTDIEALVHLVKRCGGQYGFASSHAANTFGLATIVWLIFGPKFRSVVWLFPWAALVAYSRIYVGVHYPIDVMVGATAGILIGWLAYKVFVLANQKYQWVAIERPTESSTYP